MSVLLLDHFEAFRCVIEDINVIRDCCCCRFILGEEFLLEGGSHVPASYIPDRDDLSSRWLPMHHRTIMSSGGNIHVSKGIFLVVALHDGLPLLVPSVRRGSP